MAKPTTTTKPSKPEPTGEASPPMGGNTFTAFMGSVIMMCVCSAAGFGTVAYGLEAKITELLPEGAEPIALPMAAAMFHIFVVQWLAMMVNNARVKYDVKWPTMYAESSHPNAIAYNCAQRAHQHVLEQTPMAMIVLVVASFSYPASAGCGIGLFTFSKIIGNVFGYSSGKAWRRSWGSFGYLGIMPVVGLAILATLSKFGISSDVAAAYVADKTAVGIEIATPYAVAAYEKSSEFGAMCLEKAGPYAQEAVAKTKEFGAMCVEKAGPYMDKATEAAKPYVDAVKAKFS